MKSTRYAFVWALLATLVLLMSTACTVSTRNVDPNEAIYYDATYTFADKKKIVADLVKSLESKPPLANAKDRPILVIYDVANRTSEHISTSAITDDIREELLQTGKVRFVNKEQRDNIAKEVEYQQGDRVAPESRVRLARQMGARYMLSGTLRSMEKEELRQFRLTKKDYRYYSLNMELTDIQTGLIEWADSVEIVREASKPFIGW